MTGDDSQHLKTDCTISKRLTNFTMIFLTSEISIRHLEQSLLVFILPADETFSPRCTVAEDLLFVVVMADYYGLMNTIALSRLSDDDWRRNILRWAGGCGLLCLGLR